MLDVTDMNLVEYLNSNFQKAEFEQISTHFAELGVTVKQSGSLYQFKYDIGAKWSNPIVKECRGAIVRHHNSLGVFKWVARPFDKFFNLDEPQCPVRDGYEFSKVMKICALSEKTDGSCILVYFDFLEGIWRISTLGSIVTTNMGDFPCTFEDKFREIVSDFDTLTRRMTPGFTYIFELCTPFNQIVTKYGSDRVYLLAVRENGSGVYFDSYHILDTYGKMAPVSNSILLPKYYSLPSLNIYSQSQLLDYVEKQSQNFEQFGENPEGFVLYSGNVPIAKIKNGRYKILHSFGGGNLLCSRNNVIETYFTSKLDDIFGSLPDVIRQYAIDLDNRVNSLVSEMVLSLTTFSSKKFETQKDYALEVQKVVPKEFWGYCFSNKNDVLSGTSVVSFRKWLFENYTKFIDLWKGIS